MFFNKSKKLLLSAWLLLGGLVLSSCSSFFGDSGYLITNLTTRVDEDGNTIVTITFDDEDISPVTFTIPKGISGEPGVGIASITPKFDSEKQIVTLTITYTDETLEPTVIEVPVISGTNGTDGKGITNVIVNKDEIGNTTIQFEYSDGTFSDIFTVNKGNDGVGIESIVTNPDIENNRIEIVISYTNGDSDSFYVTNGTDGTGIKGIVAQDNGEQYIITITYSNDEVTRIPLNKPTATKWYSGNGMPSVDLGNNGDFYLQEDESNSVWKKENGNWRLLFSFSGTGSSVSYRVTFDPNGGTWKYGDTSDPSTWSKPKTFVVEEGRYIDLTLNDYQVTKEGFDFNGWWTDKEITPISGKFTLLTPVFDDLTLFANWMEIISE